MRKGFAAAAAVLFLAGSGAAEEASGGGHLLGVSCKLNTLGVGADLTLDLGQYLNLRGGVNYGRYDVNVALDEADVEGNLRWLTVPILLDWYPMAGSFRISVGGMINKNRISLSADPREPIELDGWEYDIESLNGEIAFREFAPYIGIGTGNPVGKDGRVHFVTEFGVMFHGAPEVSAHAVAASPVVQDALNQALQNEVDKLERDLRGFQYYPVISLGFSVAF